MELYQWQKEAIECWEDNEGKGIVKVVTGAGKTRVGLELMRKTHQLALKNKFKLKYIIIVPTKVLQKQWRENILTKFDKRKRIFKDSEIQILNSNDINTEKRIFIMTRNTASRNLLSFIEQLGGQDKIFLIADEVHQVGSKISKRTIEQLTKLRFALGLSATPERENDYGFSSIKKVFGKIIYRFNYPDAIKAEVVSDFKIYNIAIPFKNLDEDTQNEYKRLSKAINSQLNSLYELLPDLKYVNPDKFFAELNKYSDTNLAGEITLFLNLSMQRKRLIFEQRERLNAVIGILSSFELKSNKIMIFHENVDSLSNLDDLINATTHFSSGIMSSKKTTHSLNEFKNGRINVMLSAKMLLEGVDVPDCETAIIAASSSSVRQKIQTVGRAIRKNPNIALKKIYNIYISETVDETIFSKVNWEEIFGEERIFTLQYPDFKLIHNIVPKTKRYIATEDSKRNLWIGKPHQGEPLVDVLGEKICEKIKEKLEIIRPFNLFHGGRFYYEKIKEDIIDLTIVRKSNSGYQSMEDVCINTLNGYEYLYAVVSV